MSATKAPPSLRKNRHVKNVMAMIRANPDEGVAALEIALLEAALYDLHRKRSAIREGALKKTKTNDDVKKFYRAVAKTRLSTGLNVPDRVMKAKFITIPEYEKKDGTVVEEHKRKLPSGNESAEDRKALDEIAEELEQVKEHQRSQEKRYGLDAVDGMAEQIIGAFDNKTYQGAMSSFLHENSIGQGVVAVADFFATQGNKFQFAAKAISEFGVVTGVRVAHAYFRYGGYDVPLKQDGSAVHTEMGDKLPAPGSQEKTRDWAIETLTSRLPGDAADKAKAEPPSEGFIIDKDGNVMAHAVGRGNDHFLPFSVRHLRQIRLNEGSEYVRRRMFGGPTSEDLHAAMMMGADKVTVVSNGGTFTIDLTERAHGIKMEHMQVLNRYQDMLDDRKGNLTFSGYNSALSALEAEFPLHFKVMGSERGEWDTANDRIGPKAKFMDQLRDLFDVLGGDEKTVANQPGRTSTTTTVRRDEQGRYVPPGYRTGMDTRKWAADRMNSGTAPGTVLAEMERFYRDRGQAQNIGSPNEPGPLKDMRNMMRRMRERESGGESTTRTPSEDPTSWNEPTTRVADVTQETARRVQPPSNTGLNSPEARVRVKSLMRDYDVDTSSIPNSEKKVYDQLFSIAEDEDAWDDFLNDRDRREDTLGRLIYGSL